MVLNGIEVFAGRCHKFFWHVDCDSFSILIENGILEEGSQNIESINRI